MAQEKKDYLKQIKKDITNLLYIIDNYELENTQEELKKIDLNIVLALAQIKRV
jgi:hypothetical protein